MVNSNAAGNYEIPFRPLPNNTGALPLDYFFIPVTAAGAAPQLITLLEAVEA